MEFYGNNTETVVRANSGRIFLIQSPDMTREYEELQAIPEGMDRLDETLVDGIHIPEDVLIADSGIRYFAENLEGKAAPLFHQYPGQNGPQGAYIELDEDGVVSADWNGEIGGAIPFHVYHGRTRWYSIHNRWSGDGLIDFLQSDEIRGLLARIHAGHSIDWDGNNMTGRLTEDAIDAEEELTRILDEDEGDIEVWGGYDYLFSNLSFRNVWSSDEDLEEVAENWFAGAEDNNIVIPGGLEEIQDALLEEARLLIENRAFDRVHPQALQALLAKGWIDQADVDAVREHWAEED
jgi:hypothetical protein